GEAGVLPRAEGAAGAAESSTYEIAEEQLDWLPAASVVRAVYEVVELSATSAGLSPAPPKAAAVPEATEPPVQSLVAYTLTVEPASAVPVIRGSLLFAGEDGVVERDEGALGAAESST